MLLQISDILTADQVAEAKRVFERAGWVDGKVTAGHQSARAKDNLQLAEGSVEAKELGQMVLTALQRSPLFAAAPGLPAALQSLPGRPVVR